MRLLARSQMTVPQIAQEAHRFDTLEYRVSRWRKSFVAGNDSPSLELQHATHRLRNRLVNDEALAILLKDRIKMVDASQVDLLYQNGHEHLAINLKIGALQFHPLASSTSVSLSLAVVHGKNARYHSNSQAFVHLLCPASSRRLLFRFFDCCSLAAFDGSSGYVGIGIAFGGCYDTRSGGHGIWRPLISRRSREVTSEARVGHGCAILSRQAGESSRNSRACFRLPQLYSR